MREGLPVVVAALLGSLLSAQSTLVVGPAGFATIQAAVTAASPGDEILVFDGIYTGFGLNKGVTIRARNPGAVEVGSIVFQFWNIPPGQTARMVGIGFQFINQIGGHIAFEDCEFRSGGTMLSMNDSFDSFHRCRFEAVPSLLGIQAAIRLSNSTASMVDCTASGATPQLGAAPATISLQNGSTLIASNVTVTGGTPVAPAPALVVDGTSAARLTDSTLTATGQCAVLGADVVAERCTITQNCPSFPGPPLLGALDSGAIEVGEPYTVTFRGEPGQFVLVFGSNEIDLTPSPALRTPFLLAAA
ncbi:MAG: hypothetical protein KAI24_09460, partial [Planctomycetes bacterium]|nr:hypothetical protein [Planctomycetota bacterium]